MLNGYQGGAGWNGSLGQEHLTAGGVGVRAMARTAAQNINQVIELGMGSSG